jgi:hypothetical protein
METIECKCTTNKCQFTTSCCWCADKRALGDVKTYVDEYGYLDPKYIPRDIHYCSNCRNGTESLTVIVERLRAIITPEEYHRLETTTDREAKAELKSHLSEKLARERAKAHQRWRDERKSYPADSAYQQYLSMRGKSNRERRKGSQTRL